MFQDPPLGCPRHGCLFYFSVLSPFRWSALLVRRRRSTAANARDLLGGQRGKNQVCSAVRCQEWSLRVSGFQRHISIFLRWARCVPRIRVATSHGPHRELLRHHRFPPPPDRDLSQRNFPLSDRVGPCRLAPEAPSKFCLYPCTGPDLSPADVDPKSGITNPLPNLNLTTSFRPSKTTVAKRILVDGPLRRRHRPLDLIFITYAHLDERIPC